MTDGKTSSMQSHGIVQDSPVQEARRGCARGSLWGHLLQTTLRMFPCESVSRWFRMMWMYTAVAEVNDDPEIQRTSLNC